jgi:hypothetical protein
VRQLKVAPVSNGILSLWQQVIHRAVPSARKQNVAISS